MMATLYVCSSCGHEEVKAGEKVAQEVWSCPQCACLSFEKKTHKEWLKRAEEASQKPSDG